MTWNPFTRKIAGLAATAAATATASILTVQHQTAYGLTALLWLGLLFPVLGGLLLSLATPRVNYRPASWVAYTTGIGAVVTMLVALAANTAGLLFDFKAIDRQVLVPIFDMLILGAAAAWFVRFARQDTVRFMPATPPFRHKLRLAALIGFPVLAAAGAFRLNNDAGNGLALVVVAALCAYAIYTAFRSKNRHPWWYVAHLAAFALALTLSVSLRSNHLLGFDINQEFQVFNAVLQNGIWQPRFLDGAYNACLSITLLPAVLGTLIPMQAEYIFKFTMQLGMMVLPIIAFIIAARRFKADRHYAYLAGLFFIAQAQFIFQFPGLLRQQVALLFFGLLFVAITETRFSLRQKNAFALLFGTGMVLSHYSTAYIAIVLLALLLLARPFSAAIQTRMAQRSLAIRDAGKPHMQFSAFLVPVLLLVTFLWYGQLLQATGGIVQKVTVSVTNLNEAFREDSRSEFLVDALGLNNFARDPAKLQSVYDAQSKPYAYQPAAEEYTPEVRTSNSAHINSAAANAFYTFSHKVVPLLLNALLLTGILATVALFLLKGRYTDEALTGVACGIIFLLILILPGLSQAYNIDRLYQQLLLLIGPAAIFALASIAKRLPRLGVTALPALAIAVFMVCTTGLSDQLAFKFSNINLTNDGEVYDHYYVKDGEVAALAWANGNIGTTTMRLDRYAVLPATAFTTIDKDQLRQGVMPTEIGQGDYVYAGNVNLHKELAFGYYQNRVFTFNFPDDYLDRNKDIVYANGHSRIYK